MKAISWVSGKGGTGKTTIVGNIGYILSKSGFKTILVDADHGLSCLTRLFKINARVDLIDLLKSNYVDLKDIVYPTGIENLFIIPSKDRIKVSEIRGFSRLKGMFNSLNSFDYILIDAPAGLGETIVNLMAVTGYYVIVAQPTPWSIDAALKLKLIGDKIGAKPEGFILNDVEGKISMFKDAVPKFEKLLGVRCIGLIPHDKKVKLSSIKLEIMAENSTNRAVREYYRIASAIAGLKIKPPKRGLLPFFG